MGRHVRDNPTAVIDSPDESRPQLFRRARHVVVAATLIDCDGLAIVRGRDPG